MRNEIKKIKVKVFSKILRNRNKNQTDGQNTGEDFRKKYLEELDSKDWWDDDNKKIILDFEDVITIGPSWANEVFAYFCKFNVDSKKFFEKIIIKNLSNIKEETIKTEIDGGHRIT